MASPIRLRILRLCLDGSLTNKQIAARLGRDPATVLYHVRRLVDTGFLVADPVRRGVRGSREVPYRATGKSWVLEVVDDRARKAGGVAMWAAFLADVDAVGVENLTYLSRFGLPSSRCGCRRCSTSSSTVLPTRPASRGGSSSLPTRIRGRMETPVPRPAYP
jgi:DNA-binding transcriptional ArsR family regulator